MLQDGDASFAEAAVGQTQANDQAKAGYPPCSGSAILRAGLHDWLVTALILAGRLFELSRVTFGVIVFEQSVEPRLDALH